jgi:hypothetical protein
MFLRSSAPDCVKNEGLLGTKSAGSAIVLRGSRAFAPVRAAAARCALRAWARL